MKFRIVSSSFGCALWVVSLCASAKERGAAPASSGPAGRAATSSETAPPTALPAPPPDPVSSRTHDSLVQGLGPEDDPLASSGPGDGVYGRFNGDFSLSLGVGGQIDFSAEQILPQVQLALRVYQAVGIYTTFAQGLEGDPLTRTASAGILLEPLFLLRWSEDKQSGYAFWDLTLDSLSLSVGAHWDQPRGANFGDASGVEAGVGFGVPLLARANGPWLRARGLVLSRPDAPAGAAWLTVEWQWFFFGGALEDDSPRMDYE